MNSDIKECLQKAAEYLAKNIKSLRTENRLTQKQMAEQLKISVYCLRKIENSEIPKKQTMEFLLNIYHIFGKTPSEMLEM